jgi:guanylate kinase
MLVLSSPSGAGKTSMSRELLRKVPELTMSVSVTTRRMRPGEIEGVDYHFIDEPRFTDMVARNELLEHAKVFGNYYGTPKTPVLTALAAGRDVLFDIDWQGTQQLTENAREDVVSIFVLPPSTAELERRLTARAQDPPHVVAARMAKAADEMSHFPEYDYVFVNRDLDTSVATVLAILTAERVRRDRQVGLHEFVRRLREG